MLPRHTHLTAILLLTLSVMLEVSTLTGLLPLGDSLYHGAHLGFMAALVLSQILLYRRTRSPLALLFACGSFATMIGDAFNSTLVPVQPVSLKLSWALLWFGIGYGLYLVALRREDREAQRRCGPSRLDDPRTALPAILVVNTVFWGVFVEKCLRGHDVLYIGSLLFNGSIYVLMPWLGQRFFRHSGYSAGGLLVWLGSLLIPFSDLILFHSWLRDGDPAAPDRLLYAANWIVYFGGQVLLSRFPALAIEAEQRRAA